MWMQEEKKEKKVQMQAGEKEKKHTGKNMKEKIQIHTEEKRKDAGTGR